jgi:hypothetical protein
VNKLIWQPIHAALDKQAQQGDHLFWVVAPFVKLDALVRLFDSTKPAAGLKLVSRWLPSDLVLGVSDLEVYGYLASNGCELYVNHQVHMKLYVFESSAAVSTSANLTQRGLGYCDLVNANIEVGSEAQLNAADWVKLYRVVRDSRLMTPELYARVEAYVKAQPAPLPVSKPDDLFGPAKEFTLAALPATDSPQELMEFYLSPELSRVSPEVARRAFHDLATFEVPPGLSTAQFEAVLGDAFRRSAFVVAFVEHLRAQESLRFGAVNNWIHEKCEDVPLPFRWEIKKSTHAFYNWLAHFVSEVTWDRPGYSQVIHWNAAKRV